jgi:hypothetical protein
VAQQRVDFATLAELLTRARAKVQSAWGGMKDAQAAEELEEANALLHQAQALLPEVPAGAVRAWEAEPLGLAIRERREPADALA